MRPRSDPTAPRWREEEDVKSYEETVAECRRILREQADMLAAAPPEVREEVLATIAREEAEQRDWEREQTEPARRSRQAEITARRNATLERKRARENEMIEARARALVAERPPVTCPHCGHEVPPG